MITHRGMDRKSQSRKNASQNPESVIDRGSLESLGGQVKLERSIDKGSLGGQVKPQARESQELREPRASSKSQS